MLITLLSTPSAVARCQQQSLRHMVAWIPKDLTYSSDNRTATQARAVPSLSQRGLDQKRRSYHTNNSIQGGSAAAAVEVSDDDHHHHHHHHPPPNNSNNNRNPNHSSNHHSYNSANNATSNSNYEASTGSVPNVPLMRHRRPNFIRDFEVPPDMSRLPPKFGDNQHIDIDKETWERLKAVVDTIHHKAPIRYAFAYGSGVFAQMGYDGKKKPMVDFIFAVSHPQHWHSLNLQANPHHYSFLGKLGSKAVTTVQEGFGAGVYFNPYVEVNGMTIKYGVVSIDTLCHDLLNWETMYLSGRLHKPVKILLDDPRTRLSNQVNLFNATRVALLALPKKFTSEELFTKIAGLSYTGDFRMSIGENPHKVQNIVRAQLAQFHRLYDPLIANLTNVTTLSEGLYEQNDSPLVRSRIFQKLPPGLKRGALYRYHSALSKAGVEIVKEDGQEIQSVATAPDLPAYLDKTIHSIIQIPAFTQSVKGIATAGVMKTGRYGMEKLGKWWSRGQ